MTDVVNKSSNDESEEKQRTLSLTENSPTSAGIESEYDTASTNSRSDNEQDEYEDDEEDSLDDEATDQEGDAVDDERESGDGQEELESEGGTKKKVDHDEDRSNPQYIPKKGTFYEHDDRTVEDLDAIEPTENSENPANSNEALSNSSKILSTQNQKVIPKTKKDTDRWTHDRFNENEQAPKSRSELVSAYGYDIRNEDCAPRPRRQRRYGRHQSKYDRNWEDEEAYKKTQAMKLQTRRPLRPEDFPALGAKKAPARRRSSRPQDENDPQPGSNYRSPVRNREHRPRDDRSERGDHGDRMDRPREPRNQRYNNDTSNNNNNIRNNVKGKKNINFNHNIEFKNQNRKNINYESTQPKNNNVLNQQMQSSTSSQHAQSSQGGHAQQQSGQRYNNEAAPVSSMSFTNSKMNNATSNSSATSAGSSRTILNFDNSSGNYGRGSREKDVNSQHQMHQQQQQQQQITSQAPAMSPNKNLQYTDHQIDQMKLMEKSYQQQQGKTTNLNLNQVPPHQQQMNNVPEVQMINNSEMTRSKRYSSLRQRPNLNDAQQPQNSSYHQQQQYEMEPTHIQAVQAPSYIPQQQPTQQAPANMMPPQAVPQPAASGANVQQQTQAPKYQAAYYAANPANEYAAQQAALMNAMVEKYQYQQQPAPPQYLPTQQPQQIYMPTQSQPAQQQQILNYVSTIQPQAPAAAPAYPQYTNYQNYNIQPPTAAPVPPQPSQAQTQPQTTQQPIYQTQSGLTYFPNAQIAPTHPQRIIQPQRRPNPIPILAPPDHKKTQEIPHVQSDNNIDSEKGVNSAENIDHILDNMFVQRQPYEPTISLKEAQTPQTASDEKTDEQLNDGMNAMTVSDDKSDAK